MYKLRKTYQRKLNRIVRDLNKNIADDHLWRSRFVFHIMATDWEEFEDGSGGLLHSIIRAYDKKTGVYKDYRFQFAPYLTSCSFNLWKMANGFITETVKVWDKKSDDPYKDDTDYLKIKVNQKVWDTRAYPYQIIMTGIARD